MTTEKQPAKRAPKAKVSLAEMEDEQVDLEAGKAVAKANKEELDHTLSTDDGRDIPALREERAEILAELREKSEEADQRLVEEAEEAGLHEAKLDDVGAAEQQKSARDNNIKLRERLGELTGPPVVAPVIEESDASIKVVSRIGEEEEVSEARFVGHNLSIVGEGFLYPGEVVIDIAQKNGWNHQRFSAWTEDGNIDVVTPGIAGVGEYVLHCEQLVTQVGEGREDELPLVKSTNEISFELY